MRYTTPLILERGTTGMIPKMDRTSVSRLSKYKSPLQLLTRGYDHHPQTTFPSLLVLELLLLL
jgi:hypothetical protein